MSTNKQSPAVVPPPVRTAITDGTATYQNNPFMVPIDGIRMIFNRAQAIGITLVVLVALGFFSGIVQFIVNIATSSSRDYDHSTSSYVEQYNDSVRDTRPTASSRTSTEEIKTDIAKEFHSIDAREWAVIGIAITTILFLALVGMLVGTYISAIFDYASARVAKGHTVSFGEALSGAAKGYLGYLWVSIIVGVKTFLWSLLFIIPGIIMGIRYSLAGVSYFDKGLKGNAAINNSLKLTEKAWLTTYASYSLLDLLTLGVGMQLTRVGAKTRLYQQLDAVTRRGEAKPAAHILSWLTLLLPIAFFALIVLLGLFIILVAIASN